MAKALCSFAFIIFSFASMAQEPLQRIPGDKRINDYAEVIKSEEEQQLENKISKNTSVKFIVLLTEGVVKAEAQNFAASLAESWNLDNNTFLLIHDLKHITYGFYVGSEIRSAYPDWVIEKIEHNHVRPNFRDKNYLQGIQDASDLVFGLKSGAIDPQDLKKDSSNNISIILIAVVLFFFIVFPIWQFLAMKKSHFSTKPVDFFSSVLLMNTFGTRGKNVFDDFSKGKGIFASDQAPAKVNGGGGGIKGSW